MGEKLTDRVPRRSAAAAAATAAAAAGLVSRRYLVAWLYLGLSAIAAIVYAALPEPARAAVVAWASTNLVNLHRDPAGSLAASAFVPAGGTAVGWLALGAVGLLPVNRVLGNARTAVLLVGAQVAGTLVSEGVVSHQVGAGLLPQSARSIVDVGPSYVIVCALVAAALYGAGLARVAAAAAVALLAAHLFGGLTHLDVTAVGHVTATLTGAVLGGLLLWSTRWRRGPRGGRPGSGPQRAAGRDGHRVTAGGPCVTTPGATARPGGDTATQALFPE